MDILSLIDALSAVERLADKDCRLISEFSVDKDSFALPIWLIISEFTALILFSASSDNEVLCDTDVATLVLADSEAFNEADSDSEPNICVFSCCPAFCISAA